jgi:hypothetical protein
MEPHFPPNVDAVVAKASQTLSTSQTTATSQKNDAPPASTNHVDNADYQWLSDAPMFAAVGDEPTPGVSQTIFVQWDFSLKGVLADKKSS